MSEWSSYQEAIFRNIAEGKGHTVVVARAGSGKTTTIMEGLTHVPAKKSVLMVAFNKKIEQELSSRAPNGVEVKTLHAYGLQQLRAGGLGRKIDANKMEPIVKDVISTHSTEPGDNWTAFLAAKKVVSMAKSCLVYPGDKEAPAAIDAIIDTFEIQTGWEADPTAANAEALNAEARKRFIAIVLEALRKGIERTDVIDFDDMVWLPLVLNLRCFPYDRVFIDETQDLNPSQLELALRACKSTGRILAVGDDRQAIYRFRGADSDAVNNVIKRLGAKVMKLTVCYRCAISIVAEAAATVPDFEPAPNAIQGAVNRDVTAEKMYAGVAVGDFVLSRANAPLISLCWKFIREGKPATIQGRDFASALRGMIEKGRKSSFVDHKTKAKTKVVTIENFLDWLDQWQMVEVSRLQRAKKDTTSVEDKVACLDALSEGCRSLDEMIARCEQMFGDVNDDSKRIVLSSTHKAKGLERNRVWLLQDTYRKRPGIEEENLWYVAVTRARAELFLVTGIGGSTKKKWSVKG